MTQHISDRGSAFLRRAMWMVFAVSVAGVAFSGSLTWRELTGAGASCTIGGVPAQMFGLPMCAYGLIMYAVLATLSGAALLHTRPSRASGRLGHRIA